MYRTDSLTGLLNRRGFFLEYQRLLENNPGTELTVILSDLNKLKYINDSFGHEEGDVAIKATADALVAACPSDALCVRFGGDEMIAVCKGRLDIEELKKKIHIFLPNITPAPISRIPFPQASELTVMKTQTV